MQPKLMTDAELARIDFLWNDPENPDFYLGDATADLGKLLAHVHAQKIIIDKAGINKAVIDAAGMTVKQQPEGLAG